MTTIGLRIVSISRKGKTLWQLPQGAGFRWGAWGFGIWGWAKPQ